MIADDLQSLAKPINEFKPLAGNPRVGNVEAVMRSYRRFGQRKPIVALRDGTVIAGNHQLQAAIMLGWNEIAAVFVDDDDTTAKAYAIADNRTADLGSYDEIALAESLAAIRDSFDDLAAIGYSDNEINALVTTTGQLGLAEANFLADIVGDTAKLSVFDHPEVDAESLTFILSKEEKKQVVDRLRQIMKDNDLETMSEALYLTVVE